MEQHKPDLTRKRFGQRLRSWRERKRLSLDDVARLASSWTKPIGRSSLARFESGEVLPPLDRLTVLARALDIPFGVVTARYEIEARITAALQSSNLVPGADLMGLARERMRAGRWIEHLAFVSLAQDRLALGSKQDDYERSKTLKMLEIQALLHLRYAELAKSEVEVVLCDYRLTLDEQVGAWQLFTVACYRLRRFQFANLGLARIEALLEIEGGPSKSRAATQFLRAAFEALIGHDETAISNYEAAIRVFDRDGDDFQASAARVSLADAHFAVGQLGKARSAVEAALAAAQCGGFDRHRAHALNVLARISHRLKRLKEAESYANDSNELAVATEHWDVLFRNQLVLRDLARATGATSLADHSRALRTLLSRVDPYLPEVQRYKTETRRTGKKGRPVVAEV